MMIMVMMMMICYPLMMLRVTMLSKIDQHRPRIPSGFRLHGADRNMSKSPLKSLANHQEKNSLFSKVR